MDTHPTSIATNLLILFGTPFSIEPLLVRMARPTVLAVRFPKLTDQSRASLIKEAKGTASINSSVSRDIVVLLLAMIFEILVMASAQNPIPFSSESTKASATAAAEIGCQVERAQNAVRSTEFNNCSLTS
jgi:hypothetical protein